MATERELESALEAYFNKRVRLNGGKTIKLAPTERGVPDRLVIFPMRMYFVELKTETGTCSPIQLHWHSQIRARYGIGVRVLYGRAEIDKWVAHVVEKMGPKFRKNQIDNIRNPASQ